jgi:hypothetical protein
MWTALTRPPSGAGVAGDSPHGNTGTAPMSEPDAPNAKTYWDREGAPLSHDEWLMLQAADYRRVARDITGEHSIVTDWLGEPSRRYHTYVVDRRRSPHRNQVYAFYDCEPDAVKGHAECVRALRRKRFWDTIAAAAVPLVVLLVVVGVTLWLTG